jgi:hypothetical protein
LAKILPDNTKKSYQKFSCRVEIVENVLLVEEPSGVVPGLAVFAAAPQVGQHEVAEMLGEEQTCDPEAEK